MHTTIETQSQAVKRLAAAVIHRAAMDLRSGDRRERFEALQFFIDTRSPLDLWCAALDRDTQRTRAAALALLHEGGLQ
ncbi:MULTISPECIES: hypothetical protein [unclassified Thiomonas]|jgi:hypothetical protein|uniref:hypothetical protein n=1 Tax=unclassified Thiomonas TaxID=2625466 RepID=UPI000BD7F798|nr:MULTISPECIES: hypothetical protein [unclassified Thiomonas]OZB72203.1 MAG: hypothetical protein B7X30_01035 [Thiomonas sp. 13-64-67]